jgi:hypothetical protein
MISKSKVFLGLVLVGLLVLTAPTALLAQKAAPPSVPAVDPPSICDAVAGNLVANCGFETGTFASWTQSGNTGFTGIESGAAANSGTYSAFFGPVGSEGFLTQDLATSTSSTYSLSFFLANEGGCNQSGNSDCEFNVSWDGSTIYDNLFPAGSAYTMFTFTGLTASTGSTALQFSFRQDPAFFHLDDVVVQSAPEPGSLALLSFGLASGLLGWRKKIRK